MELKQETQNETAAVQDRVYAAMETGNHGQARTLMRELKALDHTMYQNLRLDIISEYGIAL